MRSAARVESSETDKRFNYTHESSVEREGGRGRGRDSRRTHAAAIAPAIVCAAQRAGPIVITRLDYSQL